MTFFKLIHAKSVLQEVELVQLAIRLVN